MNSICYQAILKYIKSKLQQIEGTLHSNAIVEEIEKFKNIIPDPKLNKFMAEDILNIDTLTDLSADEWSQLKKQLETEFNVKMNDGILLKGKEQQTRDLTWWTGKQVHQGLNYYFERYRDFIRKALSPTVFRVLCDDTDVVMNNIGNPNLEAEVFSYKGMVVGHVQSGKTSNYSALICKAADAGYNFIVVIAGGTDILRNQTQVRVNEAFVGEQDGVPVGAGIGNIDKNKLPICLTTALRDFNTQDANKLSQGINLYNVKTPIILVIKKHPKSLGSVIHWLKNQSHNRNPTHSMLVIDDESDYASINIGEENKPTTINGKIRTLLSLFNKNSYIAYTATPYANIFIDHNVTNEEFGQDLFPKDFIFALEAPDNYFGATKIFKDTENKHLINLDDYPKDDYKEKIPSTHKKADTVELPESLYEAIMLFIINIGIRNIRKSKTVEHNSMLIHVSRFTKIHIQIAGYIDTYLTEAKKAINVYGKLKDCLSHSKVIKRIKQVFELRIETNKSNETWENVLNNICETINSVVVREVHQGRNKIPLEYRDDISTNAIVIGGTSLSRGFTLEGLSVSYFLRNTAFYDTLMQMGRWFGYRIGYEDLCYIYLPQITIDNFELIIDATNELIEDLRYMADNNYTPENFGLAVRHHPDSGLLITAKNKQKNATEYYFDMNLDGRLKETSKVSDSIDDMESNNQLLSEIFLKLRNNNPLAVGRNFLWQNVDKEIISYFLDEYKLYKSASDELGIISSMPVGYVKQYLAERNYSWDIVLYSGDGSVATIDKITIPREKRKIKKREGFFQLNKGNISGSNAEAVALTGLTEKEKKDLGNNRKKIREKLVRPLLMLHLVEGEDPISAPAVNFLAFGVSFPGNAADQKPLVRKLINKVKYNQLLSEMDIDDFGEPDE